MLSLHQLLVVYQLFSHFFFAYFVHPFSPYLKQTGTECTYTSSTHTSNQQLSHWHTRQPHHWVSGRRLPWQHIQSHVAAWSEGWCCWTSPLSLLCSAPAVIKKDIITGQRKEINYYVSLVFLRRILSVWSNSNDIVSFVSLQHLINLPIC